MARRRDGLPGDAEIDFLSTQIDGAATGSPTLDAKIATAFFPHRTIFLKNGEPFWAIGGAEDRQFEPVPRYSRSLDAALPGERVHSVEKLDGLAERWRARCNDLADADAATEPLARRKLALRLLKLRHTRSVPRTLLPKRTDISSVSPSVATITTNNSTSNVDDRDIVIAAMANELRRLSSPIGYTTGDHPDRIYFDSRAPRSETRPPNSPAHRPTNRPTLSEVVDAWEREQMPSKSVASQVRRVTRRFIDVNGDLPVDHIKKVHVREFLVRLRDSPRVLPSRLRGRSLSFFIEYGRQHPEIPKITAATINAHQIYLRIIFSWAFNRDYVDYNAASGLAVRDNRPQAEKRLPYNAEDLSALFERSTLYTGHTPVVRTRPGPHVYRDGRFWLPLMALFTGARLGELMNLWTTDLKEESGVKYLDITKGATIKAVKSQSSERAIPVHPELLKIGIEQFFEERRRTGYRYLFHELGRETVDGLSHLGWGDKWRRIQRYGGFDRPKKSFHSFRHTFKRACRSANIPEEVHDALTGHSSPYVGRRYGGGVPLKVLSEHMKTLRYPDLDLRHLHTATSDRE